MKKILFILVLFCLTLSLFGVDQPLLDILNEYGIEHQCSLKEIVDETQDKWLRQQNTERWDLSILKEPTERDYSLFKAMGFTDSVFPQKNHYDDALLLGATVQVVRKNLNFLIQEWNKGVRFDRLVLLGSDRPLEPKLENIKTLYLKEDQTLPKTELEMMQLVLKQSKMPDDFSKLPVILINSPMKINNEGKTVRANTQDTYIDYLKTNPQGNELLLISSQPFIKRQNALALATFPKRFNIETIGVGFSLEMFLMEKRSLSITLDELARFLYQLQKSQLADPNE